MNGYTVCCRKKFHLNKVNVWAIWRPFTAFWNKDKEVKLDDIFHRWNMVLNLIVDDKGEDRLI